MTPCERENDIREACRSNVWTPALREHASQCVACAEAIIVAGFLLRQAELASSDASLPSSRLMWWRAQLAAKNAAMTRATRPITYVTAISLLAGALGLLWLIVESVETSAASNGAAKYPAYLHHLLNLYANSTALMMTTGMLVCLLLGSLYVVWRE
ncbi:MAG TPA: hypothetical protein VNE63_15010 [Candidatus Acidoferrales bacterium]|nr:hypothetical protein [Candidatus Acidoferrales bacterium]